jgi:hypothetical protein
MASHQNFQGNQSIKKKNKGHYYLDWWMCNKFLLAIESLNNGF